MQTVHDHSNYNKVSSDRTILARGGELPTNVSQRLSVEEDPPTKIDANRQNAETVTNEYVVDRIVSREGSRDVL